MLDSADTVACPRMGGDVEGLSSRDEHLVGVPLLFNRFEVTFEICGPDEPLRVSEVIRDFRLRVTDRVLYQGQAVVRSLVRTGSSLICSVDLDESGWRHSELTRDGIIEDCLPDEFDAWFQGWQKMHEVSPHYKAIIADMQTFLADLRIWCQQIELNIAVGGEAAEARSNQKLAARVAERVLPCIDAMFERFEDYANTLPPEVMPWHWAYMRRQLHPLVLCAPFAHRTFTKPLGYAGDYEMVNMIVRNGWEGESLFARVVNAWFLRQRPAQAHRNRIAHLTDRLRDETLRVGRPDRVARIFNLACGPAQEVQRFLRESPLSDYADITLADFDPQTMQHVGERLAAVVRECHRRTRLRFVQKSAQQFLKEGARRHAPSKREEYDFLYCAGLLDYLPDHICTQLLKTMYGLTAPGGTVLVTNVEPSNPLRSGMEHLLDWHLIYRTAAQMAALCPPEVERDQIQVFTEETGTNVFLEIRKPGNAQL